MLIRVSFVFISLIILAIIVNSFWSQPPIVIARDNKSKYVQININAPQNIESLSEEFDDTEPEPEEPEELLEKIETVEPEPIPEPIPEPVPELVKEPQEMPPEVVQPDPPVVKPTLKKPYVEAIKNTPVLTPNTTPVAQTASSPNDQIIDDLAIQYKLQLSAWLQKYKRYPLIAKKRRYEGMVKVKFFIDDRGHLLEYEITEPSRHKSLNDAVVKMLQKASPMPEVPQALRNRQGIYEYQVPILFELKAGR